MKKHLAILAFAGLLVVVIIGIAIFTNSGRSGSSVVSLGVKEKVYVAVEGSGEIAVIDTKVKHVLKRIDLSEYKDGTMVGYMPHNVQVAPDNKSVWVTANAMDSAMKMSFQIVPRAEASTAHNDEVIVIDPSADTIIKRIEIGQEQHLSHIVLTPDSKYAIVAAQEKGIMYRINTTSFDIDKSVATKKGDGPHGLRISPDGKTAYIAMLGGKSLGILDIASFSLKDIPLKGVAVQTGVTPNGAYALASVYDAKSLAVYDIASAKLSYVDLPKEAKGPVQIYPTPDSRSVYVADQGFYFNQPVGDTVYKIDLQDMKVTQSIHAGSAPHGVIVSQDGKFVFVTNLQGDDVSVIDTATEREIAKIKVGRTPNGISLWYSR